MEEDAGDYCVDSAMPRVMGGWTVAGQSRRDLQAYVMLESRCTILGGYRDDGSYSVAFYLLFICF
jgi:hypothetical protein